MLIALFTAVIFFAMALSVIELTLYAYRNFRYPDRATVKKRMAELSTPRYDGTTTKITKHYVLSEVPVVNDLLNRLDWAHSLERLRRQANAGYPLGFFILLTIVLFSFGILTGLFFFPGNVMAAILGGATGAFPFFILNRMKKKRMDKFMNQLPEALDLIARSLRAGHAFTSGMKMTAEQFNDPLGPEFEETIDEINFGVSVYDALTHLIERVDCPDLKFFVVSVNLQRETGGNLAEIIENIAHLIRERFKFFGKVRTLSAEGKLSAYILIGLPFLVVVALGLVNPEYIRTLVTEPEGRTAVTIAGGMMLAGIILIRRMIRIRV
jgi:tight adherence protein B